MEKEVHLLNLAETYIKNTFDTPTKSVVITIPLFYNENEIVMQFKEAARNVRVVLNVDEVQYPVESLIPGQRYKAEIIPIVRRDVTAEECLQYLLSRNNVFIGMRGLMCLLSWCYRDLFSSEDILKATEFADEKRIYLIDRDEKNNLRHFNGAPLAFSWPFREGSYNYYSVITYLNEIKKGVSLFCFTKLA